MPLPPLAISHSKHQAGSAFRTEASENQTSLSRAHQQTVQPYKHTFDADMLLLLHLLNSDILIVSWRKRHHSQSLQESQ